MQYCVVDLDLGVLYFERHRVKNVIQLVRVGHQFSAVIKPHRNIASSHNRPRVAPPIAVQFAVPFQDHIFARGVGDGQDLWRAVAISPLVKRNGRLYFSPGVDRATIDVPKQRVES